MANNGISINGDTRKQNVHQAYPSHGPVEIVDLPSYKMVDLSSSLCRRLPGDTPSSLDGLFHGKSYLNG